MAEKDVRQTALDLKQHFLEDAAPLVDEYINAALGKEELSSTNASAREEVWDLLAHLMKQSSEKINIDIQSAEDIIKAVTDGKCTMEEGKQLLSLYKQAKEINTVGLLAGQEPGGLTINILSATSPKEVIGETIIEHNAATVEIEDAN